MDVKTYLPRQRDAIAFLPWSCRTTAKCQWLSVSGDSNKTPQIGCWARSGVHEIDIAYVWQLEVVVMHARCVLLVDHNFLWSYRGVFGKPHHLGLGCVEHNSTRSVVRLISVVCPTWIGNHYWGRPRRNPESAVLSGACLVFSSSAVRRCKVCPCFGSSHSPLISFAHPLLVNNYVLVQHKMYIKKTWVDDSSSFQQYNFSFVSRIS
jgi:hypothetical protein